VTKKIVTISSYLFLIIVSLLSIFPLFWMLIASTNHSIAVAGGTLLPGRYFVTNLRNLIAAQNLGRSFWNSTQYAIITTILALLVSSLAGYAFEIYHDKIKDIVFKIILITMMIPFIAILIPLFQMFSNVGLLNSVIGFLLPMIATPFLIMMFRQSTRNFPREIIDAARVDGLGELRIFLQMYIPIMKPTYAAAAVITFMAAWNSYLWPLVIMTRDSAQTMPIMIASVTSGYVVDFGMLMVAVLITTLPTVVVFFGLQRYFANGITGSVK